MLFPPAAFENARASVLQSLPHFGRDLAGASFDVAARIRARRSRFGVGKRGRSRGGGRHAGASRALQIPCGTEGDALRAIPGTTGACTGVSPLPVVPDVCRPGEPGILEQVALACGCEGLIKTIQGGAAVERARAGEQLIRSSAVDWRADPTASLQNRHGPLEAGRSVEPLATVPRPPRPVGSERNRVLPGCRGCSTLGGLCVVSLLRPTSSSVEPPAVPGCLLLRRLAGRPVGRHSRRLCCLQLLRSRRPPPPRGCCGSCPKMARA